MPGQDKAGCRDSLPVLLSDGMHGLMVCAVVVVFPPPDLDHVPLGG